MFVRGESPNTRRESKYEPIIYAETLRDELIEFAKREYGIRDPKTLVRKKYVIRKNSDDYDFYLAVLYEHRREINQRLILLIDDLYSANAIYTNPIRNLAETGRHSELCRK